MTTSTLQPTKSSTPRLSEIARHVVAPSGITTTGWPAVREKCRSFGVGFDPWQDAAGKLILAKRADGEYACSIGGAFMSIPRQVGKTYLVSALVFGLCMLRPGLRVIWTAHHSDTAEQTFQAMQGFADKKRVAPTVKRVLIDSMTVEFKNGSVVMFGARERGFGRGFPNIGLLVFDEAQILSERALSDMVPTMNTADNPLLLLMGTPPKPTDPGEVFTNRRDEALSGESDDLVYIEFSADRDADPDDKRQWAKANPSYPKRTNESAIKRMRKILSPDSFQREALGIWDELASVRSVISLDLWNRLGRNEAPEGQVSYGVKFSPDGATVALAVAVRHEFGVHVEGIQHVELVHGTQWLVDWLAERWRDCSVIVVDGKSGSGALVKALQRAGVQQRRVLVPTTDQVVAAHAALLEAVTEGTVSHNDDDALNAAVRSAGRRLIGQQGGWGFQPLDGGDVTLLEAVTHAHFGALTAKVPTRSGGRRAVVL